METLTQKSRRRENAHVAIAMLKAAIITACHDNQWRKGVFWSIKSVSSDLDIDLERLEESPRTTEAEKVIFRETRSKVAHLHAYLEGRPTELSGVDDLGWVKRLKRVFESPTIVQQGVGEASNVNKGEQRTKPVSGKDDKDDGFETQRVYGGSGGPAQS